MSILVGYGNNISHINDIPVVKSDIYALSSISTSRYNPKEAKTADIDTFMKRPIRYCFNVLTKSKEETTAFKHSYYFDSKDEAILEHRKLKVRYYDQLTKPILEKLKTNNDRLSVQDQVNLQTIFERIDLA